MKKWYHEEYEFQIEVIGFLRGDHTEQYCRNGEEIGDTYTCNLWLPCQRSWAGHLLQSHDDPVLRHGGRQKRRRFREHWRKRQILQGCRMPPTVVSYSGLRQRKNWK